MVDHDVMLEKISQIQRCLKRIQNTTQGEINRLDDINIQDIFVLNLQRAVQSAIDLAMHVVSNENLGMVHDISEGFLILEKEKIITSDLSLRLKKMVGFRNIAVHEYSEMDVDI